MINFLFYKNLGTSRLKHYLCTHSSASKNQPNPFVWSKFNTPLSILQSNHYATLKLDFKMPFKIEVQKLVEVCPCAILLIRIDFDAFTYPYKTDL